MTQVVCVKAPVDATVPYPDGRKGPDRKPLTFRLALHVGNQYELPSREAERLVDEGFCVDATEQARKRAAKGAVVKPPTASAASVSGGPGDEAEVSRDGPTGGAGDSKGSGGEGGDAPDGDGDSKGGGGE